MLPALVALAWVPLRDHLPNTDVALVLVVAVAGVGFVAGRQAAVVGALSAGVSFDVLHTRPYGHVAITHGRDVLTTALLVVAGITAGVVAARLTDYRRAAAADADALALVTDAAGLVATGGEPGLIVAALAEELEIGLGLVSCRFEPVVPDGTVPSIARDGSVHHVEGESAAAGGELVLPVWVGGTVQAHFRLELSDLGVPGAAQCRLAVHLADQAGAALQRGPVGPLGPPLVRARLRLVRNP
jgi:hypothetical protein